MKLEEAIQQTIDEMMPSTWGFSTRLKWYTDQYDGDYAIDSFDQEQFASRVGELLIQDLPENETILEGTDGKRYLIKVKEL